MMNKESFYRLRSMVLWLIIGISFPSIATLNLMEPGILGKYLSGEIWADYDPGKGLMFMSFLYFIPLVMAFLTLVLKLSINRILNKIFSIGYFLVLLGSIVEHLNEHVTGSDLIVYPYSIVLMIIVLSVSGLLIFYSFKGIDQR